MGNLLSLYFLRKSLASVSQVVTLLERHHKTYKPCSGGWALFRASQVLRKSRFLLVLFSSQCAVSRYFVKWNRKWVTRRWILKPKCIQNVSSSICITRFKRHQITLPNCCGFPNPLIALFWHFIWGQFQCMGCAFSTQKQLLSSS